MKQMLSVTRFASISVLCVSKLIDKIVNKCVIRITKLAIYSELLPTANNQLPYKSG